MGGGGDLPPLRDIWQCLEMFWIVTAAKGYYKHLVGRGQLTSHNVQTAPTTKNELNPSVHSVEVAKPSQH